MPVKPLPVAYTALGGILLFSGITGEPVSATFRSVLAGQKPTGTTTTAATLTAALGSSAASAAPGNTGASSPGAAANQALARMLAVSMGHPTWIVGTEWADWKSLWNRESGWLTTALNKGSGATGIPQLLPSAHPIPANWSSATVQITWGIQYIDSTYGSPSAAWAHEESDGWY